MRSIKNTAINVGLLTAPIKVFAAASTDPEIKFNNCGSDGERLKQVYVIDGTEEIVENDDMGKSYAGIQIPKKDLEKITEESLKDEEGSSLETLRVKGFIPMKDLPVERIMQTYLIGPDLKASDGEAFEIFVTILKRRRVAAIAKMVLRSRQKLMALFVRDDRLYAVALSFAAQVSNVEEVELRADIQPRKKLLTMMGTMVEAMAEPASLVDDQEDTFVEAKKELVEAFLANSEATTVTRTTKKAAKKNDDLMATLEASMKAIAEKAI